MQPHLRKCFEGISRLDFNQDEEIVSMVSAEEEVVPLSGKIVPAEAKVSQQLSIQIPPPEIWRAWALLVRTGLISKVFIFMRPHKTAPCTAEHITLNHYQTT